jgi:hypothetical protein
MVVKKTDKSIVTDVISLVITADDNTTENEDYYIDANTFAQFSKRYYEGKRVTTDVLRGPVWSEIESWTERWRKNASAKIVEILEKDVSGRGGEEPAPLIVYLSGRLSVIEGEGDDRHLAFHLGGEIRRVIDVVAYFVQDMPPRVRIHFLFDGHMSREGREGPVDHRISATNSLRRELTEVCDRRKQRRHPGIAVLISMNERASPSSNIVMNGRGFNGNTSGVFSSGNRRLQSSSSKRREGRGGGLMAHCLLDKLTHHTTYRGLLRALPVWMLQLGEEEEGRDKNERWTEMSSRKQYDNFDVVEAYAHALPFLFLSPTDDVFGGSSTLDGPFLL